MNERVARVRRRAAIGLLAGTMIGTGAVVATGLPASAAVTATFSGGVLNVTGDAAANTITISRNAAGVILVNNGAITVVGGRPTVANTSLIKVIGRGGADTITLNEAVGALPRAQLFGGPANDTLTGGSGGDQLFGQRGNDTLLGKGGIDFMTGAAGNDTITGGDADDQAFGQGGNDRMIWNPGDDTDLNEGGVGDDTVEVNGGGGAEQFTTTANGARVRFDRLNPAPFAIDIGTSENLVLNANGGDDSFSATGNLAALIKITVDGGVGNDTLLGSNGIDVFIGGDGVDFVDGQQGNDVAFLGAGDDTFQWDPGDGSDIVEGQAGSDEMLFNGSAADEDMDASAVGGRVRFLRNVGNIVMDLNDVESIVANMLVGADDLVVNDLSGTDLVEVAGNLAASAAGGDDAQPDNVVVNATNDDDAVLVAGQGLNAQVTGLPTLVSVSGAVAGSDRVTVNGRAGDDVIDATGMAANAALLTLDGGDDDDVLLGGDGNDVLIGGPGDDVLVGGPGTDTTDGGDGDNVVIQSIGADTVISAAVAGEDWLARHARTVAGQTVLEVGGTTRVLPEADLLDLTRGASSS